MRQLWIADTCREWGLIVTETVGWRDRGKSTINPRVLVLHHTAGPAKGDYPSLGVVTNGRPDVPGPLCNVGLGRSGTVYVVASGVSNNAGKGSWRGVSGNANTIGIEAESVGTKDDWTPAQRVAYPLLCAALLDGMGRDTTWMCAHREWAPTRKTDPAFWDMDRMRADVQKLLDNSHHEPPPPPQEDDDMAKLIEVPNTLGTTDIYRVAGVRAVHVGTAGLADAKANGDTTEKWKGTREGFVDAHDLSGQPLPR